MPGQDTIRLQALDGVWETLGVDRLRGVEAEQIRTDADDWGCRVLSCTLKRDGGAVWPDLGAFTPLEYERDGVLRYAGRLWDTPTRDQLTTREIALNARGYQYHLDDDQIWKIYAHARLGEWVDTRTHIAADLSAATYSAAGQVVVGDGGIAIGWAKGAGVAATAWAGVSLDLGPDNLAKRVVVTWKRNTTAPNALMFLYVRGSDTPGVGATTEDLSGFPLTESTMGAAATTAGTFATFARRYVNIFAFWNGGAGTFAEDHLFQLTAIQVFTATAYESGNASILKASQVAADMIQYLPLLSTDTSKITTSSFAIPEFYSNGYWSPREFLQAVNAYEDYLCYVDAYKQINFAPRPTAPTVETTGSFEDASSNSAEQIYNKIIGQASGGDGLPVISKRFSSNQSTAVFASLAAQQLSNGTFEVNTTGWTAYGPVATPSIARDVGVFDNSVASMAIGRAAGSGICQAYTISWSGSLVAGRRYKIRIRVRRGGGWAAVGGEYFEVYQLNPAMADPNTPTWQTLLDSGDDDKYVVRVAGTLISNAAFQTIEGTFVARYAQPMIDLRLNANVTGTLIGAYVDNIEILEARPTLPDRRNFVRAKTLLARSAMTPAGLTQIGDLWLRNHVRTPLKGTAVVRAGDATTILGGAGVSPSSFLGMVGQQLRIKNQRDPDTGASHRDGIIASVTYDADSDTATVAIDSERGNFEALLERLAIVTGQIR